MLARTIDEVIEHLTKIIDRAKAEEDPMGYFPALYRMVTIKVKEGIEEGYFDDGIRMERLDVVFANRYLQAHQEFTENIACSESWKLAFRACKNNHLLVLQHLMLGMNAHINLDLGLAAAKVCPAKEIFGLKEDFYRINGVLAALVGTVQDQLGQISPFMAKLDRVAGRVDEKFADFSMSVARGHAWKEAQRFAGIPTEAWPQPERKLDRWVTLFGSKLERPGFFLRLSLRWIQRKELRPVSQVISILEEMPVSLAEVKQRIAALPAPAELEMDVL